MFSKIRISKYKIISVVAKLTLLMGINILSSCNEAKDSRVIEPAFYYWKTVFKLTDFEKQKLDSLHVNTIYIKFFDVGWKDDVQRPVPIAKLQANNFTLPQKFSVIPTVFITNECIQKIHSSQIAELADNIYRLMHEIINSNGFNNIKEIQIDCDWTANTRSNYFLLLEKINILWENTAIPISATIRLHQIKFMGKTGVPPVDRGLLMCYNMGNLKNPVTKNSIIETAELKKYVANLTNYPLPLDVAFPLFDWKVLFRKNIYTGLIENLPDAVFTHSFTIKKDNRYELLKDTLLQGYDLKKGDVLRSEQSDYSEIVSAAGEVNKRLKNTRPRVSLYHLDSVILKKYTLHELETIYSSMR
jgi:hypothetical protein